MNDKTLVEEFDDTCSRCHELLPWDALYLDNGERLCHECEDRAALTPAGIAARLIAWANSAEKSSMAGTATLCHQAADTIEALQSRIEALEAALRNPPRHKWWNAGEPDCPPELKAPNGELWRMQCKVCGNGTGDGVICQGGLKQALESQP